MTGREYISSFKFLNICQAIEKETDLKCLLN